MSTRNMQGVVSPIIPASAAGGSNYSGVYTLDQLNRLNAVYPNHIPNSLRFRSSASAYLNRTPASASNRQTWTWSGWVKRGEIGTNEATLFSSRVGSQYTMLSIRNSGSPYPNQFYVQSRVGASEEITLISTQVFRDPSSWYHIVVCLDTTQATSTNRVRLYVNGSQVSSFAVSTYPAQNYSGMVNYNQIHAIAYDSSGGSPFDGYMADINFIDGQALDPSYFGVIAPATGVWSPKKYTGTYGTNGFHLNFSNGTSTTTLGYDSSGNGNNWTTNNISLTSGSTYDWMLDSPTPFAGTSYGVGNYAVGNPLLGNGSSMANGNLSWTASTSSGPALGTIQLPTTGKWYWEVTPTSVGDMMVGIQTTSNLAYSGPKTAYYRSGGASNSIYLEGTVQSYNPSSYTDNDVVAVAYNADSSQITWYKNNVQQGGPFTLTSLTNLFPIVIQASGAGTATGAANFGQRPFQYTPPSGYKSLCTYNLPTPTIQNGANYMAATLYTGNGSTQSIVNANNGVSFQPDFVWIKDRSGTYNHRLVDSVRGVGGPVLYSSLTNAEGTDTAGVTSLNSNGFAVGIDAGYNKSSDAYIGWQWKAGGTAVTNTAGSITSSVSANTTAGFSVVTYTGTGSSGTIGHGLGVAPSMIIAKWRSGGTTQGWPVYHITQGNQAYLTLNSTAAVVTSYPTMWNATTPTSTVFSVGTGETWTNASTWTYVAYCFAAIPGYSAFGSYTGNGSSDGPFVYCGFRPRFILIKNTGYIAGYGDWYIYDTSRNTYNVATAILRPDTADSEQVNTAFSIDLLSNGFKIKTAYNDMNANGYTYIYAAFAENPFQYSLAR